MLIEDKRNVERVSFEDVDDGTVFMTDDEEMEKYIFMKMSNGQAVDLEYGVIYAFSDSDVVRLIDVRLQRYS